MKTIAITFACICINFISLGQENEQLKLTKSGFEPIVFEVEKLSSSELYEKTHNWVQETYENPDEVLKAKVLNEKIRVKGFMSDAFSYKSMGMTFSYDISYTMEVEIKDYKYRILITINKFYNDGKTVLFDHTSFFKSNGDVKKGSVKSIAEIENNFSALSDSLNRYVTGNTKSSDW